MTVSGKEHNAGPTGPTTPPSGDGATREAAFYSTHHDRIFEKRFSSPYSVRRRVHRDIYDSVLRHIEPGMEVLDAGCGEGVLSILMAARGARVTGLDQSAPNIQAAKALAAEAGLATPPRFETGDTANLSFPDGRFDCVVSNHVLEHLPDFDRGIAEVYRVARTTALIAVPTCLNPCAWALLGGDTYWRISKRTPFGLPFGLARVLWALARGQDGVNEGYAGRRDLVHVFRFPGVVRRALERAGFEVVSMEAQSLRLPYIDLPVSLPLDAPGLRAMGVGTLFVLSKPGFVLSKPGFVLSKPGESRQRRGGRG